MAEAEQANPFDVFDPVPDVETKANPFDKFDVPADAAPEARTGTSSERPLSKMLGWGADGLPIFENEEDNKQLQNSVLAAHKWLLLGAGKGLLDIPDAISQLGTRGMEALLPEGSRAKEFMADQRRRVEESNAEFEKQYQATKSEEAAAVPDVGRFVGNVAATAPIAGLIPGGTAAALLPRIAAGGVGGGVSGALQPVMSSEEEGGADNFWKEKAKQAAAGIAGGMAMVPVAAGIGRIINPNVRPEVRTLMESGVTPTPGQIGGGVWNRLEEAAQSIPFVGDAIKAARGRAVEDLNRAAINRSLQPINAQLAPDVPMGREAIGAMHETIGQHYDQLVPQLNVQGDAPLAQDFLRIHNTSYARMSDSARAQFDRIMNNEVARRFDPAGRMSGEDFKAVESELGRNIRDYSHSPSPSDREVGRALSDVQTAMRQVLMRSNPDRAAELAAANEAFAHALRVEGAAAKSGTDQGVFTPAHLLQSVRQLDPSLRKGAYARGDALMQELADAGKTVLGNKVPDSGTPLRSMVGGGAILGPLYAWNPAAAGGVAAGGLGAMGAYSRPGVSLLAHLLAARPPGAAQVAGAVRWPGNVSLPAILAARQIEERRRQ